MEKLIEMRLEDEQDGVFAISIVSNPAIESDFLALSDSKILLKIEDNEKRILTGAILIPNLPILRKDENGDPYHIFFSSDTVESISQLYLKNKNQDSVTVEHEAKVEDVTLTESWIKTDEVHDKSVALGIDAPLGSWIGTMKVDNDELWTQFIKAGHLNGFSIEAKMTAQSVNQNLKKEPIMATEDKNFMEHVKSFFLKEDTVQEEIKTVSQEDYLELCGKVDTLTNSLQEVLQTLAKKEEVEAEAVAEEVTVEAEAVVEEVIEEPKEEVQMLAHTDTETEEVKLQMPSFDYKLTPSQRIELAMKQSI